MTARLNLDGSIWQTQGGGSRHPVQRIVRRIQVDGEQRGEVHLTLCKHGSNGRPPRSYLQLHAFTKKAADITKPLAFNATPLGRLITELRRLQEEMEAGETRAPRMPTADTTDEPPRRVRGRRCIKEDVTDR